MTDGIGGKTITMRLAAKADSKLNLAWGYWDPAAVNESTGSTGKWNTIPIGEVAADSSGIAEVTVEMPANTTRMALEVWNYTDSSGKLDTDSVILQEVLAS